MLPIFKGVLVSITKVAFFLTIISSCQVVAAEVELATAKKNSAKKAPLVIKSQVKGSQEQPNVIYIMPWQGIENPIRIEGNTQKIVLPHFKPINPKSFKKQARLFYKVNSNKQEQTNDK